MPPAAEPSASVSGTSSSPSNGQNRFVASNDAAAVRARHAGRGAAGRRRRRPEPARGRRADRTEDPAIVLALAGGTDEAGAGSVCTRRRSRTDGALCAEHRAPHPVAAARCAAGLVEAVGGASIVAAASAAAAAAWRASRALAALAPALAAELFDLAVAKARLDDGPTDVARFLVLGREPPPATGADATSVLVGLDDSPGRLAEVLDRLGAAGVNLRRIASRPTDRRGLRDLFFVDLDGHRDDPACRAVLDRLATGLPLVKVLGSYPRDRGETRRERASTLVRGPAGAHGRHRGRADRRLGGAGRARAGAVTEVVGWSRTRDTLGRAGDGHHRSGGALGGRGGPRARPWWCSRPRCGASGEAAAEIAPALDEARWCSTSAASKAAAIASVEPAAPGRVVAVSPDRRHRALGPDAASPLLFEGKRCVICPTARSNAAGRGDGRTAVDRDGRGAGAHDGALHDRVFGAGSHLPHVAAYALAAALGQLDADVIDGLRRLPTSSLRDTTRVAASSPAMWRDIFLDNRAEVLPLIDALGELRAGAARRGRGRRRGPDREAARRGQGRARSRRRRVIPR